MAEQREIPGYTPDDVVNFFNNILSGERIPGNQLQDRADEIFIEQNMTKELSDVIKKVEEAEEAKNDIQRRAKLEIIRVSERAFRTLLREGKPMEELTSRPPEPKPET